LQGFRDVESRVSQSEDGGRKVVFGSVAFPKFSRLPATEMPLRIAPHMQPNSNTYDNGAACHLRPARPAAVLTTFYVSLTHNKFNLRSACRDCPLATP
jgi:hypothetical protein